MVVKVESGDICPLMGKTCIGLQCAWFTKVQGVNPNTGKEVEDWACAIAWLPMLAIENSQNTRMAGAAVESFRNNLMRGLSINEATAVNIESNDNQALPKEN
tara:strand:+ start:93 stop:398 length:306 start_codon:yes stop_codon:yes gene_type:complete